MNKQDLWISRSYHIPLSMFDAAFRSFQHKYVFPRNIILTVVLLAICGVYVHAVIKDSSQTLGYLLITVCLALIMITWYNTFRLRRSRHNALREVETDLYDLNVYSDGMTVLARDADGSAFTVETAAPLSEEKEIQEQDGNGFQPLFPEEERQPLAKDGTPLEPTEIEFGKEVRITEYAEFFMVYLTYAKNFYLIPKQEFSDSELHTLRGLFGLSDKQ